MCMCCSMQYLSITYMYYVFVSHVDMLCTYPCSKHDTCINVLVFDCCYGYAMLIVVLILTVVYLC